jgi:Rieske 2Fe-2S family protein
MSDTISAPSTQPEIGTTATARVQPALPAADYWATEVWERERDTVFATQWVCLGRTEELGAPGDFVVRDLVGESILLTRATGGQVHAFYNVCRHRGSELCDGPSGSVRAFVCPYHNWTYGLDGALLGTPNVGEEEGLDRSAYGLTPLACEVWDGFIFVNQLDEPPALREQLAIEPDEPLDYERYGTGDLVTGAKVVYEVGANWKIVHDNFNECLHCPGVHPELVKLVPLYRKGQVVDLERPDLGATLDEGLSTFTLSGTSSLPTLPGLTETDCRTYWGYSVFPNLMVNLLSTGVMAYTLYPRSPSATTIVSEYLFRPETVAAEGFDPGDMVEFLDLVSRQDWTVCERAQRGASSKGFVQGVLPPQDGLLVRFAERYRAVRGPMD